MIKEWSWGMAGSLLLLLLKAGAIFLVGHFAVKGLLKLMLKSLKKTKIDYSLEKFLLKAVNIVSHAIIVLSVLNTLGISTTGLLAALSAAAVGIALALKDSLSSIAAGILLLISPRFATGDFIEINGESGTVMQIDLIHTTLKTVDNRHVIIPNSTVINSQLTDYSSEPIRRLDMVFSIGYDDDAELAKQTIADVLNAHPLTRQEPEKPFVRVKEYSASSVDIQTRVWCRAEDYWTLKFDLTEQTRRALTERKITIPYPQLDVHLVDHTKDAPSA